MVCQQPGHPTSSCLKPVKNAKKRHVPIFRKHMKINGNYSFSAEILIGATVANEAKNHPRAQKPSEKQGDQDGTIIPIQLPRPHR